MVWEYKTLRLVRPEGSASWDEEADSYSRQLSKVALEGWELVSVHQWPWCVFKRRVEGAAVTVPQEDEPVGDMGGVHIAGGTKEHYIAALKQLREGSGA
jgi:hypothetical protein